MFLSEKKKNHEQIYIFTLIEQRILWIIIILTAARSDMTETDNITTVIKAGKPYLIHCLFGNGVTIITLTSVQFDSSLKD